MPNSFLLHWILYALLSFALAGGAILFCDTVGKHLRSRTCLLLLLLICIRAVIPTGFSPFALFQIPTDEVSASLEETLPSGENGAVIPGAPSEDSPGIPVPPDLSVGGEEDLSPGVLLPDAPIESTPSTSLPHTEEKPSVTAWQIADGVALCVWIVGAFTCFFVFLIPGAIDRRRLRRQCKTVTDEELLRIYADVCAEAGAHRIPSLRQSTAVHSPCLCGILSPCIILPRDGAFSPREIEMLLRHEVQHERHGDLLIKYLVNLCLAVQWWNPFLYVLAERMSFYIESSCDDSVLDGCDAEFRLQYTALLAKLAKKSAAEMKMHYALEAGFARHHGYTVLRRVQNLLSDAPRKRGGAVTVAVILVCVWSLFLYGFAPSGDSISAPEDDTDSAIATEDTTDRLPTDRDTTVADESEPPVEETTVPSEEETPQETSVFVFRKMTGVNYYELSAIKDRTITEAIIPSVYHGSAVARIADQVFADCKQLTRVVVPDSVKDIGNGAFLRCSSLRDVTLSSNLYSIGTAAFRECTALEQISIPMGVMTLQPETFYRCTSLRGVTLTNGLQQIQSRAFADVPMLTQLVLPASVWMLNVEAIKDCTALSQLSYAGSMEQWGRILKRTAVSGDETVGWCSGIATAVVKCADGTVNIQE